MNERIIAATSYLNRRLQQTEQAGIRCTTGFPCNKPDPKDTAMLVTFRTEAFASVTMFGDVAVTLIKLMGHSGAVPSALMPEDIPEALVRLKAAVAANPDTPLDPEGDARGHTESEETHVSLAHRALPLIELLTAAAAQKKYVMWE